MEKPVALRQQEVSLIHAVRLALEQTAGARQPATGFRGFAADQQGETQPERAAYGALHFSGRSERLDGRAPEDRRLPLPSRSTEPTVPVTTNRQAPVFPHGPLPTIARMRLPTPVLETTRDLFRGRVRASFLLVHGYAWETDRFGLVSSLTPRTMTVHVCSPASVSNLPTRRHAMQSDSHARTP